MSPMFVPVVLLVEAALHVQATEQRGVIIFGERLRGFLWRGCLIPVRYTTFYHTRTTTAGVGRR